MKLDLTAQKLWKATPSMVQKNNYSLSHCFSGHHQIWTAIFSEIYLYRYIIMVTPLEGQPYCHQILVQGCVAYSGSGNETTTDQKLSGDVVVSPEAPNLPHCLLISAYSYCQTLILISATFFVVSSAIHELSFVPLTGEPHWIGSW